MALFLSVTTADACDGESGTAMGTVFDDKTFCKLQGISIGATRKTSMVVGAQTQNDGGVASMGEIIFRKKMDAYSPVLLSFFHSPGTNGQTVVVTATASERTGKGDSPIYDLTLEGARVSSYSYDADADGIMNEVYTLTFIDISQQFYYENSSGEINKGEKVAFDVGKGEMTSGRGGCKK